MMSSYSLGKSVIYTDLEWLTRTERYAVAAIPAIQSVNRHKMDFVTVDFDGFNSSQELN